MFGWPVGQAVYQIVALTIYGCILKIPVFLIFVIILDPPNVNALGGLQSRPMINQ